MAEETKGNSPATGGLDRCCRVMKENDEFLRKNAGETYEEVMLLITDAFEFGSTTGRDKSSMVFFIFNILIPSSSAISTDLLTGNLPACFMELRLMLESLAKCYFADLRYPEQSVFQGKLELLEGDLKKNRITISEQMRELGNKLRLKDDFFALWSDLSKDWVHTRGVVGRIVNQISEKSRVPSWALLIPMNYAEDDLDTIKELGKRVFQFRNLLRVTIENNKREFSFEEVREHD